MGLHVADGVDDLHAADTAAEDGVLVVQPGGGHQGQEELGPVGVRTSVGRAQLKAGCKIVRGQRKSRNRRLRKQINSDGREIMSVGMKTLGVESSPCKAGRA